LPVQGEATRFTGTRNLVVRSLFRCIPGTSHKVRCLRSSARQGLPGTRSGTCSDPDSGLQSWNEEHLSPFYRTLDRFRQLRMRRWRSWLLSGGLGRRPGSGCLSCAGRSMDERLIHTFAFLWKFAIPCRRPGGRPAAASITVPFLKPVSAQRGPDEAAERPP